MRKHFFEYYDTLTDDDKKCIFEDCLFVFDTNVILNLYRYTEETRDKMLSIMEKYQSRIWMPYQVGWEYFNNREHVIDEVSRGCDTLQKSLTDHKNAFFKTLDDNYKRHPYIDRKIIKKIVQEGLDKLNKHFDKLKESDPKYAENDSIQERLTTLFENNIGDDYNASKLNDIYAEGVVRYKHSIPPGYADLKDKKDMAPRHLYGDLIVWKQTIDKAKEKGMDIVFVSDDQKEDWYDNTERGTSKRPRRELIKEFGLETGGHRVLLYNQDGFLYYIERYLGDNVDERTRKEVKEVAEQEATKLEERRRRTNEILQQYSNLGTSITDASAAFDSAIGSFASTQGKFVPVTFPKMDFGDIPRLMPTVELVPTELMTTLDSMRHLGEICNSAKTQNALASLASIDDSSANQIKKLTEVFNPKEIELTQKWIDSLPKSQWIPFRK